jgi:hypothetical protein
VRGFIRFDEKLRPKFKNRPPTAPPMSEEERRFSQRMEWGQFDIDFASFWKGGPIAPVPSTTRLGDNADPLRSVMGVVLNADTVGVVLNPQFTHGGLVLGGKFSADTVVEGFWNVRGDHDGTKGHFLMTRQQGD